MVTRSQCSNALESKLSKRLPMSLTPKIHQCSNVPDEPVVGVEAVQPRRVERTFEVSSAPQPSVSAGLDEAPLNITLPHRDVEKG